MPKVGILSGGDPSGRATPARPAIILAVCRVTTG